MKKTLTLLSFVFAFQIATAQNPHCDSLDILHVGFNPFNMNQLLVQVANNNVNEIFSYPAFKLLNANGDTVAEETPNFFGIGQETVHHLNTTIQNFPAGANFTGELLLYTNFYDSLQCVFPVSAVLVPNSGCSEVYLSTTDYIDSINQVLNWSIIDEQDNIVASGAHDHTVPDLLSIQDTICLENGCYTLRITPQSTLHGNTDIALDYLGYWVSTGIQMLTGSNSLDFDFSVYYCDSIVSVNEQERNPEIVLGPNPIANVLNITWDKNHNFETLQVMDLSGRVLRSVSIANMRSFHLSMEDYSNGVYLLQFSGIDAYVTCRKVVKAN